jgi:ribonuclease G
MGNQLVIHCAEDETRVALIEHGLTTEFYVERRRDRGLVGNIYKGRVLRVLPGMQSAFVDIGLERTAFLHVTDIARTKHTVTELEAETTDAPDSLEPLAAPDDADAAEGLAGAPAPTDAPAEEPARAVPIEQLLREGQEILLQIAKEPIGTKGARVTSHISLPGRNIVYLPTVDHIGVSRRIGEEEERARLKTIAEARRPPKGGLIVRTVGEGKAAAEFDDDIGFLLELWDDIRAREQVASAPACIYRDLDLILRATRDLLTPDFDKVVIDSREDHARLVDFVRRFMPTYVEKVELWEGEESLFDRYGIEMDLSRALERKVWLKSGGTIVIDETEALTAIDVNTGRYVGKANLEDTILKINLEAVKEIAYQLRLRNIGGIIIIDFIDMESAPNRERVQQALADELVSDKARCNVLRMSELGLVEMTRKRVRESLRRTFTVPCFYCGGRGYLKSLPILCSEIVSRVKKEAATPLVRGVQVFAHPKVTETLMDEYRESIEDIERRTGAHVIVKSKETFHLEQFEVFGRS